MFQGFSDQTKDFLFGLMLHNERPWFEEHRKDYQQHLLIPFRELSLETADLLHSKFPDLQLRTHISRIYRDARRAHGKGPYKDHLWVSFKSWDGLLEGPMFWFEIGALDYSYGAGFYSATPAQMAYFRKIVTENPKPLLSLVKKYNAQNRFLLTGEEYVRAYPSPDPLLDHWFNKKRLGLSAEFPFGGDLYSPQLPHILLDAFTFLLPYYEFFAKVYLQG